MKTEHNCPKCTSESTYQDMNLWVCMECFHEWNPELVAEESKQLQVVDLNGNVLSDGDSIVVAKDLKVKGASSALKVGAKAKNIRLVDSDDGHNIVCKIDGFGEMHLKSEFVKKV